MTRKRSRNRVFKNTIACSDTDGGAHWPIASPVPRLRLQLQRLGPGRLQCWHHSSSPRPRAQLPPKRRTARVAHARQPALGPAPMALPARGHGRRAGAPDRASWNRGRLWTLESGHSGAKRRKVECQTRVVSHQDSHFQEFMSALATTCMEDFWGAGSWRELGKHMLSHELRVHTNTYNVFCAHPVSIRRYLFCAVQESVVLSPF